MVREEDFLGIGITVVRFQWSGVDPVVAHKEKRRGRAETRTEVSSQEGLDGSSPIRALSIRMWTLSRPQVLAEGYWLMAPQTDAWSNRAAMRRSPSQDGASGGM